MSKPHKAVPHVAENVSVLPSRSGVSYAVLRGNPSRGCRDKSPDREVHLYVFQRQDGLIKVGKSADPERRRLDLQNEGGLPIRLLVVLGGQGHLETGVHRKLVAHRIGGEWFRNTTHARKTICSALGVRISFPVMGSKNPESDSPLSQKIIQAVNEAQPRERPYKIRVSTGFHVLVTKQGSKCYRLRFDLNGKEQTISLGTSDDATLTEAFYEARRARAMLREGIDPRTKFQRRHSLTET